MAAMVLAVNMPPQAPSPGQALRSICAELVLGDGSGRAGADRLEDARDVERQRPCGCPGRIEPA